MGDPLLVATILNLQSFPRTVVGNPVCHREGRSPVAISSLSLEKLGFLNEEKEKDNKGEVRVERPKQDNSKHSGEEEQKQK
jgi:hypothetical protein